MIQLDKKSGHSRTPPGRSQKHDLSPRRFTRSLSPDIDSNMRKRRLFELDASGLFAEADIDSQSAHFLERWRDVKWGLADILDYVKSFPDKCFS
jgi:hypothetical protein